MKQSPELEDIFSSVRTLDPTQQNHIKTVLLDMLEQARDTAAWEKSMQDPHYMAYVEAELNAAEEDRLAGRVTPLGDAMTRIKKDFTAKHGL